MEAKTSEVKELTVKGLEQEVRGGAMKGPQREDGGTREEAGAGCEGRRMGAQGEGSRHLSGRCWCCTHCGRPLSFLHLIA